MNRLPNAIKNLGILEKTLEADECLIVYFTNFFDALNKVEVPLIGELDYTVVDTVVDIADMIESPVPVKVPAVVVWIDPEKTKLTEMDITPLVVDIFHTLRPDELEGDHILLDLRFTDTLVTEDIQFVKALLEENDPLADI